MKTAKFLIAGSGEPGQDEISAVGKEEGATKAGHSGEVDAGSAFRCGDLVRLCIGVRSGFVNQFLGPEGATPRVEGIEGSGRDSPPRHQEHQGLGREEPQRHQDTKEAGQWAGSVRIISLPGSDGLARLGLCRPRFRGICRLPAAQSRC